MLTQILTWPIRQAARWLWVNEWIPLGRWAPWVLAAWIWRWPHRVKKERGHG